jgi:hypothetical protein
MPLRPGDDDSGSAATSALYPPRAIVRLPSAGSREKGLQTDGDPLSRGWDATTPTACRAPRPTAPAIYSSEETRARLAPHFPSRKSRVVPPPPAPARRGRFRDSTGHAGCHARRGCSDVGAGTRAILGDEPPGNQDLDHASVRVDAVQPTSGQRLVAEAQARSEDAREAKAIASELRAFRALRGKTVSGAQMHVGHAEAGRVCRFPP